jgi:hypothetical protein
VEGEYAISDSSKRSAFYGEGCFNNLNDTYKCEIRMKENGKIAWTSLEDIVKEFDCSLTEAMSNSASMLKIIENQKINRNVLTEISKNFKL